jgi:hypothetical protein
MIRRLRPSRLLASWVLLVLVASSLLPLRGEWDRGRLAPWSGPISLGGRLDSVELALPGAMVISRGSSRAEEGGWGKDLLDFSAALAVIPALFWRAEWETSRPADRLAVLVGAAFEAPALLPRPPPLSSPVT